MNCKRIVSILLCVPLLLAMFLPAAAAGGRITHGTATEWITEDQLNNTPPKDYVIDPMIQGKARSGGYNAFFLKDELQTVHISIEENNLNYLLQNAMDEPYVMTNSVTIGASSVGYCGLRTKGNFTLVHSYTDNPGSDRFSFTINFGKYITAEGYGQDQNFHGVDKISFNNFFFDKSMMKEFLALELMSEMGVPTPQHGLAKLYINGQYYGVYAMVETLDTPILEQYFGCGGSELGSYLCKPTGTNLIYSRLEADPSPLYEYSEDTLTKVSDMMPTVMEWARRLNCLSSGTDFSGNPIDVNGEAYLPLLEQIMNVDEVLRYFATHSWLCQMDNMFVEKQNFGLYISPEGVSTLVPWDYDLSFGCYYPSHAEATANFPVDVMFRTDVWTDPVATCTKFYKTYPLFNVIYQNKALRERFHGYMLDCSRIALLGGTVEATGKTYDPGHFGALIDALEQPLTAAAKEPLASNVYYMNHIRQPQDLIGALPNLKKIVALRSIGVYNQLTGSGVTVSASGCNLETLGNGIWGESSGSGTLTVVDPVTGIFATSEFRTAYRSPPPSLAVTQVEQGSEAYQKAVQQLAIGMGDRVLVYQTVVRGNPKNGFTVTIPLSRDMMDEALTKEFYVLNGTQLQKADPVRDDNRFTFRAASIGTIVVLAKAPGGTWLLPAAAAALLIILAATLLLSRRRKK